MKNVTSSPVVRLSPETHRQAKVAAAIQGVTLSELVGNALSRELARRAKRMAKADSTISAAMADPLPMQTR